ncbi:efflux RND transporter periplasmic adaptor subunit [Baaleninema sp.]|uniref:efflux RND transporter periplasmic adaptor subunit n=1 Tax=Baaleninema sp. TaxID=3101197 RepID=UPI003D05BE18
METGKNPALKRGIGWIAGSAVLAAVSLGGWVVYSRRSNSAQTVSVRVLTVERTDVERTVNESGTVKLGSQQTLKAPSDATVIEVKAAMGDRVSPGQELLILRDDEELTQLEEHLLRIRQKELDVEAKQQKVENARGSLEAARRERDRVLRRARDADRASLVERQNEIQQIALELENKRQAAVDARETLTSRQEQLERDRSLYDRGFISLNQLQDTENAVRQAEAQLRQARLEVQSTQLRLESSQASLETVRRQIEDAVRTAEEERREAASAVRAAEIALEEALYDANTATLELQQLQLAAQTIEEQLQSRIVSAPIGGKILDIDVVRGDVVQIGESLLTLGDPDREIVELQLSTLNAKEVRSGQPARISVIGPDEEIYEGQVERISLSADGEMADSGSRESLAAVNAIVNLDEPSGALIPGSQVNVEIVLDRKPDAVALDIEAIQQPDTDPFVWLLDDSNTVSRQPVTLGLDGLTIVEILSGLEPGDRVAIPPIEAELEPGTTVEPN